MGRGSPSTRRSPVHAGARRVLGYPSDEDSDSGSDLERAWGRRHGRSPTRRSRSASHHRSHSVSAVHLCPAIWTRSFFVMVYDQVIPAAFMKQVLALQSYHSLACRKEAGADRAIGVVAKVNCMQLRRSSGRRVAGSPLHILAFAVAFALRAKAFRLPLLDRL